MDWIPEVFEDLPSEETPLDADNMNHLNDGILIGITQSSEAKNAASEALNNSKSVLQMAQNGDFDGAKGDKGDKGDKGEDGLQGVQGIQGVKGDRGEQGDKGDTGQRGLQGDAGPAGRDFHIDGRVDLESELPAASTVPNQWWIVEGTKLIYHSHNDGWVESGSIAGVKGDKGDRGEQGERGLKGDKGASGERGEQGVQGVQGEQGVKGKDGKDGVFDVNALTEAQLKSLHEKLKPLDDNFYWSKGVNLQAGQEVRMQVGDMNLDLRVRRSDDGLTISSWFLPNDASKITSCQWRRFTVYDTVGIKGDVSTGWKAMVIQPTGVALDLTSWLPGRDSTRFDIIDKLTAKRYVLEWYGLNEGTIYFDITRRAVQGREFLTAT